MKRCKDQMDPINSKLFTLETGQRKAEKEVQEYQDKARRINDEVERVREDVENVNKQKNKLVAKMKRLMDDDNDGGDADDSD